LHEKGGLAGIEAGGQPVGDHLKRILDDTTGVGVMRGQSMPVGDEVETLVLVLELDPILQSPNEVPHMELAGGPHAAEHALLGCHPLGIPPAREPAAGRREAAY